MNIAVFLGVVLLATLSNAGIAKREVASEIQDCMNNAKPFLARLKEYFIECELSTRTNQDASDSSDQESDEEASKACFDKKNEEDTEGTAQVEACYNKIQELPQAEQEEAMAVFNKLMRTVMGADDSDED